MTDERRERSRSESGDFPAFPCDYSRVRPHTNGMSKREHYAALICAGLMANPAYADMSGYGLVDYAIDYADRLVERLAKADREDA
jgi:hypothetical protein